MRITIKLLMVICIMVCSTNIISQEVQEAELSKLEIKHLRLKSKVSRAELKIDKYNIKIRQGDSLIQLGIRMQDSSQYELSDIRDEENTFLVQQNSQLKVLNKRRKKAPADELKEIDTEIKFLDKEYATKTREFAKRTSTAFKKMDKGIANQGKGDEKIKLTKPLIKDANEILEIAKQNLNDFEIANELK